MEGDAFEGYIVPLRPVLFIGKGSVTDAGDNGTIRVLYVDDERELLEIARAFLERNGDFCVDLCDSPRHALDAALSGGYDAIVSDYQMLEMNGIEFLKAFRSEDGTTPFIIFTGRGREEVVIEALNSGADFYLQKGGDPRVQFAELAHKIRQAVSRQRSVAALARRLEIEAEIAAIASRFVRMEDTDAAIDAMLDQIGHLSGADRTYLFRIRDGGAMLDNTHEWCAPGVRPEIDGLQGIPAESVAWWMATLRAGKPIHILDVSALPPEAATEKEILERQSIRSLLVVPVTVSGSLVGFMGLDNVTRTGEWSESDLSMITSAADIVGHALGRRWAEEKLARALADSAALEEELRESEARYRTLFDAAGDAIFVHDLEGRLLDANSVAVDRMGYSRDRLRSMTLSEITAPECADLVAGQNRRLLVSGRTVFKTVHITGGGSRIPVEVSSTLLQCGGRPAAISVARDITERRRAEQALREANTKLNLMSELTRHDILNQLTILLGHLGMALETVTDPDLLAILARIEAPARAIRRQIEFTRHYTDLGVRAPEWQDVAETIFRSAGGALPIHMDVAGLSIYADPLLGAVFSNLMDNSVRHGESATAVRVHHRVKEGGDLTIFWEDDGIGIAAEEKERIFARGAGMNTGLGLFLIREILGITGIAIREAGEPGRGAQFVLLVPAGAFRTASA